MEKMKLSELKDRYRGRAAAVLGGGPSWPMDLSYVRAVYKDALLIAVNYHAWQFEWPDYMVFNDFPEHDPKMLEEVEKHQCTLVSSKEKWSDVVFDVQAWEGNWSSCTATWFALWLGCEPVVLCGMDCYQGEVKYCHPWVTQPSHEQPLDVVLRPWIEEGRHLLPHRERVEVVSGPLQRVFKPFHTKDTKDTQRDTKGL